MAGMKMGLEMKMSQQLIMTPQLQQAIKLLQLSRIELQDLIDQALIENPTLEIEEEEKADSSTQEEEAPNADDSANLVDDQNQLSYDDEWQNYVESGAGVIQEVRHHEPDEDSNPLEATISRTDTLMDHLLWQLDIGRLSEIEHEIAEFLIGNIDDDGYLSTSLRELLATLPELKKIVDKAIAENSVTVFEFDQDNRFDTRHDLKQKKEPTKGKRKKVAPFESDEELDDEDQDFSGISDTHCAVLETVLQRLQRFDPPGVGSRDLKECLLLQLRALGLKDSLSYQIIDQHMALLEQKDLKRIARLQKAEIEEVVEAYQLITELEPKPGRPYGKEVTQYVVPDVFIYKRGAEYVVSMNQDSLPRLRINPYYQQMAGDQKLKEAQAAMAAAKAGKKEVAEGEQDMTNLYLQEKIKAGDWLMKSIEQRQKTIFRVSKSILKYQYEFFEKGIDYLKPLVLKDVAEDIEVHESTVSRITTNKYVYTPQGIFELKYFFTSGIDQGDGDVISSKKIKDYIKKLIDNEEKKKPLTDLQIKNILKEKEEIKVARRTVAKYREAMNILPSNKRKQLF